MKALINTKMISTKFQSENDSLNTLGPLCLWQSSFAKVGKVADMLLLREHRWEHLVYQVFILAPTGALYVMMPYYRSDPIMHVYILNI